MISSIDFLKAYLETRISPMALIAETKKHVEDYIILDVRNGSPAMKQQKILGSLEIPEAELANRLTELPKDKIIVVYCWETWCLLGDKAALLLLEHGYNAKVLSGGIHGWETLNLPLTKLA